jgi:hypothetical protein
LAAGQASLPVREALEPAGQPLALV